MKKMFLFLLAFVAIVAEAQTKGNFEVLDLGSFKLHVYNTNDALGDASYIIEGRPGLLLWSNRCLKIMYRNLMLMWFH